MKTWKFILAAVVVFAAGALTGGAFVNLQAKARQQQAVTKRNAIPFMIWQRFEVLRHAERQLELTPEQHSRIDAHIKEAQERFRKLWEPVAPAARGDLEQLREQVLAELTPAQKVRFLELLRRRPWLRPGLPSGESTNSALPPGKPTQSSNAVPAHAAGN